MSTVNNTNFFDFGVEAADTQLMVGGASSGFSQLLTPIQFFERRQRQLFVSQLCILGSFMMMMLIPALFSWGANFHYFCDQLRCQNFFVPTTFPSML